MFYHLLMFKTLFRNWKPGAVDVVIIIGAVTNLLVIALILIYYFLSR